VHVTQAPQDASSDPHDIQGSNVQADYGFCPAWLDNDGSGNMSGVLSSDGEFCGAEFERNDGVTASLSTANTTEATTPLSDAGHTIRICAWNTEDTNDKVCSPWFGLNNGTPTQEGP
jgi:hypothetical protein